jgi:hypothetical protein
MLTSRHYTKMSTLKVIEVLSLKFILPNYHYETKKL